MSRSKRTLLVVSLAAAGLVAAAALVLHALLQTDPIELLDQLDVDALDGEDVEWTSGVGLAIDRYIYADIEAVRQATTKTLEELGYSPTEAGPHTRPDGAQLDIDVTLADDGPVVLRVTVPKLEQPGQLEPDVAKAYVEEASRPVREFFTTLFRHLPSGADRPSVEDPPPEPGERKR